MFEQSGPTFVPMKNEDDVPHSSTSTSEESNSKSVRFNGVVEVKYLLLFSSRRVDRESCFYFKVRELSPNEAVEALMARLSYSASIRAEVATRRCAEKLSSLETMKVAATFSLLVHFEL